MSAKRPEAGNNGVNKKPLRRSPRFIEATGNAGSGGSIKKFQNCGMIYGGNQLRRSPRFIRATENDGNYLSSEKFFNHDIVYRKTQLRKFPRFIGEIELTAW